MALTAITKDFITRTGIQIRGTGTVTSSTGQTGALQVDGGAAVAKNLIVGQGITAYGTSTFNGPIVAAGGLTITGSLTQSTATFGTLTVNDLLTVGGVSAFNNTATFNSALVVSGSNTLTVGTGATTLGGSLSVTGTTVLNSTLSVESTATVGGVLDVNNTDAATEAGAGSLQLAGGAFVEKNVIVNGTGATFDAQNKYSNGLVVDNGGAWIEDGLFVNGPTTFAGSVTFSGTATYVYSTNTYYTDNFIDMHVPPGGIDVDWEEDDGKDIGLIFHYYKADTDKTAFLGFANDTGYLEWYENGSEVGSVYTGSAYGTFKTGDIRLVGTNNATSTQTGALQVVGGAGIGGDLYVGGLINGTVTSAQLATTATNALNLIVNSTNFANFGSSYDNIQGVIPYQYWVEGDTPYYETRYDSGLKFTDSGVLTATTINAAGNLQAGFGNSSGGNLSVYGNMVAYGPSSQELFKISQPDYANTSSIATAVINAAIPFVSSNTTNATSTQTGALQVAGGAGIGGDMYVGGTIYGTATAATTATNLAGGAGGSVPYQTAAGVTAFVAIGGENTVLTSKSGVPTWSSAGSTSVGSATTATNLSGGAAGQIAFQTGTGLTGFDADLTFSTATDTLSVAKAAITNTATAGAGTGALTVAGGAYIADNLIVANGATVGGSAVITTSTIGDNAVTSIVAGTDISVTGTVGAVTVDNTSTLESVTSRGATTAQAIGISNTTNATSTTTGALTVTGGAGVGGDMYVGGMIYSDGAEVITTATFVTPTLQSVTTAGATTDQAISISAATSSTGTGTGALTVTGGVGIGENVNVGGYVKTAGPVYVKDAVIDTATVITETTATTTIDSFSLSSYRSARYTIQVIDGIHVHVTEISLFYTNNNVYLNEYGTFFSGTEAGTFDANYNSGTGNINLTFTPVNSVGKVVTVVRTALANSNYTPL